MFDPSHYLKRVMEFPAIVRRPDDAKLSALRDAGGRVLVEERGEYQKILLLETPKKELLLLLDGELQFYSGDEHRFHESLAVIPVLHSRGPVRRVGIMGGGDGLAARELLRHFGDEVESIKIVDIDPRITELARTHPRLVELNSASLSDDRVEVVNADARGYRSATPFDLVLVDLPDPTTPLLGRLYTREFYGLLKEQLATRDSLLAVQIVYVPPLFDGVLGTLRAVFPQVREYAVWMYSFVRAGFGLCGSGPLELMREIPSGARHLTRPAIESAFYFAPDEPRVEPEGIATDEDRRVDRWYAEYLREYFEERILYY